MLGIKNLKSCLHSKEPKEPEKNVELEEVLEEKASGEEESTQEEIKAEEVSEIKAEEKPNPIQEEPEESVEPEVPLEGSAEKEELEQEPEVSSEEPQESEEKSEAILAESDTELDEGESKPEDIVIPEENKEEIQKDLEDVKDEQEHVGRVLREFEEEADDSGIESVLDANSPVQHNRFPEIHRVQNKILDLHLSENSKTFLFTSPHAKCGTTTILSQVAFSLSKEIETRILIIDFSVRGLGVHKIFQAPIDKNITEEFLNRAPIEDLVVPTCEKNIDLFSLLMVPVSPQNEFSYDLMIDFLYKAREGYDFVLLDLPPINERSKGAIDTPSVSRLVDGVILVAKWRTTKVKLLKEAKEELTDFKANILGVILNEYH